MVVTATPADGPGGAAAPSNDRAACPPHPTRLRIGQHLRRFGGNADAGQTEIASFLQHHRADSWVQMHVLVGIGMIQCQSGRGKSGELCGDFSSQLAADAPAEE